ncbi:hypothetical protein HY634_04110 [Candidatus Uhrbacteria bacterium]|nr:hypothetical protein [Candidatus Uhrbacteria bacterium]
MYTAFECTLCKRLHRQRQPRCTACNYPELREVTLEASAYCEHFGHDGGETRVSGTARFERTIFVPLEEDGITIGGGDENVYSHEYLFRCARCGFEQRTRR